jgi:sugar-phosphatase
VRWLAEAELADVEGLVAIQGASPLLAALAQGEWAVVTSGGRQLALLRLQHVGLPVPTVLLAAEDVNEGKPSPEGYRLAARHLGVEPTECVVIEDTPAGIKAGRAAGAKVLAVRTTFPVSDLGEADAVVKTLAVVRITRSDGWLRLNLGTQIGDGAA